MTDEPRKASDVLLKVEEDLSFLKKDLLNSMKNIDFLLKNILAKLNIPASVLDQGPKPELNEPVKKPEQTLILPQTVSLSAETKVVVHQKVFYPDSRPTPLADVKVYQNGQQIAKTKTNAQGKWTVKLLPGEYQVHILKVPVDNKPKIDAFFPIKVLSVQQMEIPYQPSLSK